MRKQSQAVQGTPKQTFDDCHVAKCSESFELLSTPVLGTSTLLGCITSSMALPPQGILLKSLLIVVGNTSPWKELS